MHDLIKKIPFLIWDDYYDDDCIPDKESQSTEGFIEEYDLISEDEKLEICSLIHDVISNLDPSVEVFKDGTTLQFKHLTHKRRMVLVEELKNSKLCYQGIPILFYSES